jgi:small subunit ribosomal protein S19
MTRTISKLPYVSLDLKENIAFAKRKAKIRTQSRSSMLVDFMLNRNILIYNGKAYHKIFVDKLKIGRKLGEFSITKKRCVYRSKKNKKKKKHSKKKKANVKKKAKKKKVSKKK